VHALARVAEGGRVIGVEPITTVGLLVDVLDPRRALTPPRPHAPDFDRADAIGSYWGNPKTRTFAELLIDCEGDRVLRAVLVGS
jgi:hypothetical protein